MKRLIALTALTLVPSVASAGAAGGPVRMRDAIAPGERRSVSLVFERDEAAQVRIRGDNSADLDCFVYTSDGQFITKDDDITDYCVLAWVPQWRGKFEIVVRNRGSQYNEYVLQTN